MDENESTPIHQATKIGKDGFPINVVQNDSISGSTTSDDDVESIYSQSDPISDEKSNDSTNVVGHTSFMGTVLNLLNSTIGAGILGVPNTFVNTGIILSIVILLIMAVLSKIATDLLLILGIETSSQSLGEMTEKILGRAGSLTLSVLNLVFSLTALVAYLVLAGDMITSFFDLGGIDVTSLGRHALMILVYALLVPIALTIPRNISFLRYFSTTTVFCILFFCISMLYKVIDHHKIEETTVLAKCDLSLFSSLSIYALTFSFPSVIFAVTQTCDKDLKVRKNVVFVGIIFCVFFVVFPGICGYLMFGKDTDANILKNFDSKDILIIICRVAFLVIVSCSYPMVAQNHESMWSTLIFNDGSPARLVTWKRSIILILTNIFPLLVAMFLPSVKPALSIGGALGGCLVDFVFPSVLYLKLHRGLHPLYHWKNVLLIAFAIFGILAAVISTYQSIVDAIKAFS